MNNLPERPIVAFDLRGSQARCDERFEDYLDHLGAPLIGIVPYSERNAFRQEALAHIEGLAREFQYQGRDLQEAMEAAMHELGEPWKVGQAFLEEWCQGTTRCRPSSLIRRATIAAFGYFGSASMLTLILLEQVVLVPNHDAQIPIVVLLAFFSPFVAGVLVAFTAPAQAERGVRNAALLLLLHFDAVGGYPRRTSLEGPAPRRGSGASRMVFATAP